MLEIALGITIVVLVIANAFLYLKNKKDEAPTQKELNQTWVNA